MPNQNFRSAWLRTLSVGQSASRCVPLQHRRRRSSRESAVSGSATTIPGRQAKVYLCDYYTNPDGELVCQGCHDVMPFRLSDGAYYFEAPEFVRWETELAVDHLALCPTCSAKWRFAKEAEDTELLAAHHDAAGPEIEVSVAGVPVRLRFVQVHLDDLRASFGAGGNAPADHASVA